MHHVRSRTRERGNVCLPYPRPASTLLKVLISGATTGTTAIAVSVTAIRLYTRIRIVEKFGIDDVCITGAAVCSFSGTVPGSG
jgi:hypothetical protein